MPSRRLSYARKNHQPGSWWFARDASRPGKSVYVTNRAKTLLDFSRDIFSYTVAISSSSSRRNGAFLSVLACSNRSRHDCKSKSIVGILSPRILPKARFLRESGFYPTEAKENPYNIRVSQWSRRSMKGQSGSMSDRAIKRQLPPEDAVENIE